MNVYAGGLFKVNKWQLTKNPRLLAFYQKVNDLNSSTFTVNSGGLNYSRGASGKKRSGILVIFFERIFYKNTNVSLSELVEEFYFIRGLFIFPRPHFFYSVYSGSSHVIAPNTNALKCESKVKCIKKPTDYINCAVNYYLDAQPAVIRLF